MRKGFALFALLLLLSPLFARGGGGCFLPGTLVSTLHGDKPIEQIAVGEEVLSFEGSQVSHSAVSQVYRVERDFYYAVRTECGEVWATAEHLFYVGDSKYIETKDLRSGGTLFILAGSSLSPCKIISVERVDAPTSAYNLQAEGQHTFFANGIAVHNKGGGGGGGGGCFLAGTQVLSPSGAVPIESINPGETVYSFDENGSVSPSVVQEAYAVERSFYYLLQAGGYSVNVTAEHPFLTSSGYVEAQSLKLGDEIYVYSGGKLQPRKITAVSLVFGNITAYNLQVAGGHTFIANGFAVHNKGGGFGGSSHSSGPPPNVFYYDCNKTYDNSTEILQCCKQISAIYTASPSVSSVANLKYPYCACDGSKCNCSNYSEAGTGKFTPVCPFNLAEFLTNALIAIVIAGVGFGFLYWVNKTQPRLLFPAIIVFTVGSGIFLFATGLSGVLFSMLDFGCPAAFIIIWLWVVGSAVFRKGRAGKANSEWSSTTSAPIGKVLDKAKKVSALLSLWSKVDGAWDEQGIKKTAESTFLALQKCWQSRDYTEMKPLLTPSLYGQHLAQLEGMKSRHEINRLDGLKLLDLQLVLAKNFQNKETDEFTAWVKAQAKDTIVDDRTGAKIRGDEGNGVFEEFWTFQRSGKKWLLRQIDQPEEGMEIIGRENYDEQATPGMMAQIYERGAGKAAKADVKTSALREQEEADSGSGMDDIKQKGGRVHRLLNFLYESDKIWNEQNMKDTARYCFIAVNSALERKSLITLSDKVAPELFKNLQASVNQLSAKGQTMQKRNLTVRNVEIVLVRNFSDSSKDEFTAWVAGQAQQVLVDDKTGKDSGGDSYVRDFEEYWTFSRMGNNWLLKSIDAGMAGKKYVSEENVDEGVSTEMLNWYYTKDRTV